MPTDFRKDTRQTLAGIFVQDDFRVRQNLTLTLGLRWSYFGSISENSDDLSSVVLGSGNAALTGLSLRLGGKLYDVSKTDFGPQVSAAWSPSRFDERLVIRGGAGLAYNGLDQAISLNGRGNAPFLSTAGNLTGSQIVYGVNSFPSDVNSFSGYGSNPATIASFDPNTNLPIPGGPNFAQISLTGYPAEWPTTRAIQYSAEAEYDLGHQWVASLGYQGSTTDHLTIQRNLNLVLAAQGVPLNPVVNHLEFYSNDGNASFNALLAGIRHRFSNSFELTAQYRLSRSMDDGSNNFANDAYVYDPERGVGPVRLRRHAHVQALGRLVADHLQGPGMARKDAGRLDDQRDLQRAFGIPLDAGLCRHRLRGHLCRESRQLRSAPGRVPWRRARGVRRRCVQEARRQFPRRRLRVLHAAFARGGTALQRRRQWIGRARADSRKARDRTQLVPRPALLQHRRHVEQGVRPADGARARQRGEGGVPGQLLQSVQPGEPVQRAEQHSRPALRRSAGRPRRPHDLDAGPGSASECESMWRRGFSPRRHCGVLDP